MNCMWWIIFMKPIRFPRFLAAVQKAMEQLNAGVDTKNRKQEDDYIFVKTESKGKLVEDQSG